MKVKVEFTTRNGNAIEVFDASVEKDVDRFFDFMNKAAGNPEDFISLLVERVDDARGTVPT